MNSSLVKIFILLGNIQPSHKILSGMIKKISFLALLILPSCMGPKYTPAQIAADFNDLELCRAAIYHGVGSVKNTDDVIAEINRRGLISETEWRLVNTSNPQSRNLMVGMSECSMLLVMDNNSYEITETISEFGVNRLYEYGHYGYGPYIFVDNGKVTSWTF